MQQKLLFAVFTTLLQLASAASDPDNLPRCGKNYNNTICPPEMCCSHAGYCGITEDYCSVPGNCQRNFGLCDNFKMRPSGVSLTDGKRPFDSTIQPVIDRCSKPRTLALSFDDGPSEHTNSVLDVLLEHGARATFFLGGVLNGRGSIDQNWAPIVKRMVLEGHQIGSHSWSHPNLDALTAAERKAEMYNNERAIVNVIGKMPTFMRPPMIICNEACQTDMKGLGYHVVKWQHDSEDWKTPQPTVEQEFEKLSKIMDNTPEDGNMFVIQHDTSSNAVEVTRALLNHMKTSWQAVPLVECLGHSLDDAYQFPKYLEFEGSADEGCLVSGPGMCILPVPFESKESCQSSRDILQQEVSSCHMLSKVLYSLQSHEHCRIGDKIVESLGDFCNDCGKKGKAACSSKNFVWQREN